MNHTQLQAAAYKQRAMQAEQRAREIAEQAAGHEVVERVMLAALTGATARFGDPKEALNYALAVVDAFAEHLRAAAAREDGLTTGEPVALDPKALGLVDA